MKNLTTTQKSKVGAPTKRTPQNAATICECLARGLPQNMACSVAGISQETYFNWKQDDESFRLQIELAVAQGVNARLKKIEAAGEDDWRAMSWLLEHCNPELFAKTRVQIEAVGQFDHSFTISQATLDAIAEARAKHERELNGAAPVALPEPKKEEVAS
jgi:hypothetical protein